MNNTNVKYEQGDTDSIKNVVYRLTLYIIILHVAIIHNEYNNKSIMHYMVIKWIIKWFIYVSTYIYTHLLPIQNHRLLWSVMNIKMLENLRLNE